MNERISKYITFKEATKSQTAERLGIPNIPTEEHLFAMKLVGTKIFDPTRAHFKTPIGVSSFYRAPELNRAIGGSKRSQHAIGEAIDMDADMYGVITNAQIYKFIRDTLDFDQLIWEFGNEDEPAWVHVSYKRCGDNRKQMLRAYKEGSLTRYMYWQ